MTLEGEKRLKGIAYYSISGAFMVAAILFSIFYFRPVATRTWQAIKDFASSSAYYGVNYVQAFGFAETVDIEPSVTQFPSDMTAVLPLNWGETKAFLALYGKALFSWENIGAYAIALLDTYYFITWCVLLFLAPAVLIGLLIFFSYRQVDNDHGQISAPLKIWWRLEDIFWYPPKRFIVGYLQWLKGPGRWLKWILIAIWLYNLNVFTIILEILAYLLYFAFSFDIGNLFVQIGKIAVDATVALTFIPKFVWVLLFIKVFHKNRTEKGFERLKNNEAKNKQFLIDHPENIMATGEPRVGKTQLVTVMTLSQDAIFREKAKAKAFQRQMQFPFFPWAMLEQTIHNMQENVKGYNLDTIRSLVALLKISHSMQHVMSKNCQLAHFAACRRMGYTGRTDFIFGYDVTRFPIKYNNKLKIVEMWESILMYAEEYYIHTCPTPLSVGNFPIRFDIQFVDYGNMRVFNVDPFRSDPADRAEYSQFNHKYYFDMSRLGKKKHPKCPYNNNFEIGSATIAEIGKERGNQVTNKGNEVKGACNQANDGFEMDAKMHPHGATIDFECYFRIFSDEQRAMDLLAALREIGSELKVSNKSKDKIALPGFHFEMLCYETATYFVKKFNDFMKLRHGKQTLLYYVVMRLYSIIYNHYTRIYNQFGYYDVDIKLINMAQGQTISESDTYKYHVAFMMGRAEVYDTGYFGVFYDEKLKKSSTGGINQIPQWSSLRPTMDDLRDLGSHHYDKVFEQFEIDSAA